MEDNIIGRVAVNQDESNGRADGGCEKEAHKAVPTFGPVFLRLFSARLNWAARTLIGMPLSPQKLLIRGGTCNATGEDVVENNFDGA
jgi:hypothetical protein